MRLIEIRSCFLSLRTRDRLMADVLRLARALALAARVFFVEFFDFRQNVLFGPLATLHPLTFLHRLGFFTLFPWHRLFRFLVAGMVVYTHNIISLLQDEYLRLESPDALLHALDLRRLRGRGRPDVAECGAACPVQNPGTGFSRVQHAPYENGLHQLGPDCEEDHFYNILC